MKYQLVTVSCIHIAIGKQVGNIPGYTESVIETVFPTDEELEKWSNKKKKAWEKENNKRMVAIRDFLNSSGL